MKRSRLEYRTILVRFTMKVNTFFCVSVTTLVGVCEVDSFNDLNGMHSEILGKAAAHRLLGDNESAVILSGVQTLRSLTYS